MELPFEVAPAGTGVDVVALGENSLDFVGVLDDGPASGGKRSLRQFQVQPGGQMATAAVGCARQGLRVRYVGAFGSGEWSARVRTALEAEGVDVLALVREDAPARVAIVLVAPDGDRVIYEHRAPALRVAADEIDPAAITSGRVLLLDATQPSASLRAADLARRAGIPTIVDVDRRGASVDDLLQAVDVVAVPEAFATSWTGEPDPARAVEVMARRCPAAHLVVVTRGPGGSLAWCRGAAIATPGFAVDVVDTTGAGDAFRAGLACALVQRDARLPVEDVLSWANATAALNCRAAGAQTALPSCEEVRALVATRGGGAR